GGRSPGGGLCLEADLVALDPEPRTPFLDLDLCPPPEALRVPAEWVDAELLEVRGRTGRHENVEIRERRGAERRVPWHRGLGDGVHRLPWPVLTHLRQAAAHRLPELGDRVLLADQHSRARPRRSRRECAASVPRRNDVRPDVTERPNRQLPRLAG